MSNIFKEFDDRYYTVIDTTDLNRDYQIIFNSINSDVDEGDAGDFTLTYKDLYYFSDIYEGLFINITGKLKQIKETLVDGQQIYVLTVQQGIQKWFIECNSINDILTVSKGQMVEVYGALKVRNPQIDPTYNRLVCMPTLVLHQISQLKKDKPIVEQSAPIKKVGWGL